MNLFICLFIYTAEKSKMVWPQQKDAGGENTKNNFGLDTTGDKEKRTSKKKRGRKEYKQP